MTRQEKRNLKDLSKQKKQQKQKAFIQPGQVRGKKAPRERLDTAFVEWDHLDAAPSPRAAPKPRAAEAQNACRGQVTGIQGISCSVLVEDVLTKCACMPGVAVGDFVIAGELRVERILPRRTVLSRPDPHNPRVERVLAANIDVVVHVVSVTEPPLRAGLIDRYLVAIERGGAAAMLCVNKVDLGISAEEAGAVQSYEALGVPVFQCSAATGTGLDPLLAALAGKLCVFTGHSGVGKSSLLNALSPDLRIATKKVSETHGKGRHTTTASAMYSLPNGARVIDTPGIREFGLWQITASELFAFFPEFRQHASACTYSDCRHLQEPVCGVKAALDTGMLPRRRYEAYLRILETLEQ